MILQASVSIDRMTMFLRADELGASQPTKMSAPIVVDTPTGPKECAVVLTDAAFRWDVVPVENGPEGGPAAAPAPAAAPPTPGPAASAGASASETHNGKAPATEAEAVTAAAGGNAGPVAVSDVAVSVPTAAAVEAPVIKERHVAPPQCANRQGVVDHDCGCRRLRQVHVLCRHAG